MAFSDNVWWTRKARIQAEKRHLSNSFQSQVLLLWYSFLGVASAVYYLNFAGSNSSPEVSGTVWVVFSVLIMSMSGFVSGLTLKQRAGLMKESYERLNEIYRKSLIETHDFAELENEYNQVLGLCENHLDRDYYRALCLEHLTAHGRADKKTGLKGTLDRCPTWYHWGALLIGSSCRGLMFAVLYALPIIIFLVLEQ